MIRRGQVFVRAKDAYGHWGSADVLDLEEESFRSFVVDRLWQDGLVIGLKDEDATGREVELRTVIPFPVGPFKEDEETAARRERLRGTLDI